MNNKTYAVVRDVFRKDDKGHIEDFGENELIMYVLIQDYYLVSRGYSFLTMGAIYDDLKITNRTAQNDLVKGLENLIEWGLVELVEEVEKINKNALIKCRVLKNEEEEGNFTVINREVYSRILESEVDYRNKKTMLSIVVYLESVRNNKDLYSYPSYDSINYNLGYSNTTIVRNLELLEEIEVLAYGNAGMVKNGDNIVSSHNTYVLCDKPDFKGVLAQELRVRREDIGAVGNSTNRGKNAGKTRRMNNLRDKFEKLEVEELIELEELELDYFYRNLKFPYFNGEDIYEESIKFCALDIGEVIELETKRRQENPEEWARK